MRFCGDKRAARLYERHLKVIDPADGSVNPVTGFGLHPS